MTQANWTSTNFERHYRKHPGGEDRDCWCDLCGVAPGPVDREAYRRVSLQAISEAWLVFAAEYRHSPDDMPTLTKYFVDQQQCLTAVDPKSCRIKTCYHNHPHRQHTIGSDVTDKSAFIKHWISKKVKGVIASPRIEKLDVDQRIRKLLSTYVKELSAPMRSRRR